MFISLTAVMLALCAHAKAQTTTHDVGGIDTSEDKFEGSVFEKAPVNFAYTYSFTQQIYTREELTAMAGREVTSMRMRVFTEDYMTYDYSHDIKIYFKEVDYDEFVKSETGLFFFEPVAESELVFTGNQEIDFQSHAFVDDIELVFDLAAPFAYGGKDLLITVVKESPEAAQDIFNDFYCYPVNVTGMPYRTLFACDDVSTLSTPYPTKMSTSYTALKQRAVIEFTTQESTDPDENYPIPVFAGLEKVYSTGDGAVELKVKGIGKEAFTVFKVNGAAATAFNPTAVGKYKVEALSVDGKQRITTYVTVK